MIIGNQAVFALEHGIKHAFSRLSFRALGYFIIYISGRSFGVRSKDATMLSNSFDEVQERLNRRGLHIAPFSLEAKAGDIADAFRDSFYSPNDSSKKFLGIGQVEFRDLVISNHLIWAPDGGAAFDDGSYVLHFDVDNRVRLIAYQLEPWGDDFRHNPNSICDQWLDADEFYGVLNQWREEFTAEWISAQKIPEDADSLPLL